MAIDLDLTVNDRGSAVVGAAANRMSASLAHAQRAAMRLGGAFSGAMSRLTGLVGRMLSFEAIVGLLAGGTGLGLLVKKMMELGQQSEGAGSFNETLSRLSTAWNQFTGRLGQYVAQSPMVREAIDAITRGVYAWGDALVKNKDVIDSWVGHIRDAIQGVIDLINSAIENVAKFYREMPIRNMTGQQAADQMSAALAGHLPEGYIGSGGGSSADYGSQAYWEKLYPSNGVTNNIIINEKVSRSDAQAIISEMERNTFRGSVTGTNPSTGGQIVTGTITLR